MKSLVLILTIILLKNSGAQNLWKSAGLNNPDYSLRHQQHNQRIIYGQPENSNPTGYVQRTNTIHQSTFVPLKTLFDEEDSGKDNKFNSALFFTLDEWPLHLDTEEFQPEVIVDDLCEPNNPTNRQTYHHYSRTPDVVSVEKTHFSLGPGNIKEEETYFNNKDGQVHAMYHTVEATIQGFNNSTLHNVEVKSGANDTNSKSEFTEETILINPDAYVDNLENLVRDDDREKDDAEPYAATPKQKNITEEQLIVKNSTEA